MVQVKLTKKSVPCLTFEVELPGLHGSRTALHDIPVTVLPRCHSLPKYSSNSQVFGTLDLLRF